MLITVIITITRIVIITWIGNVTRIVIVTRIFFIIVFSLIALPNQSKFDPWRAKKASSITYNLTKHRTHAHLFSQTLVHGNNRMKKNKQKIAKTEKSKLGMKKISPRNSYSSALPSLTAPMRSLLPKAADVKLHNDYILLL